MTEIAKKSVLITGCSPGGIGHALAREFHSKGLHVIATARDKIVLADLEELGMTTLSLDVTNTDNIREAKTEVEKLTGGRLDILVNNAGRNCTMPALDVDLNDARACFETNFFSIITITQTFTPLLIASKGLILNIGSVAAIVPYVFGSVYNASKAALHAFSNTLRLELEPFGVRVLVVVTGGVKSRIARTERVLPEGSLYVDIESSFERRVKHSQEGAMLAEVYARGVVREALKSDWRQKKWMWRGNKSALVWGVWNFLGNWAFDMALPRMFGLDRLRRIVRGRALGKAN
ncbi:related to 1-acyldihydroxyacetone-phosphate reductase [Phialocephala subalpina]|uniref:Related to 1-acyldihydroxyacetone-phosphate reductase n=1 Tax=Phialocephala subalpina TaxID=576137 RepID=A0A1L7XG84_9HELO|nr:related to 1-acyldihydroxyacetone-phosphate reductase [Phialocephala subalpina]